MPLELISDARERHQRVDALLQRHTSGQAPLTAQETQNLIQELQTHRIELQMQNEALQKARDAAVAATACYIDFYDFAPVGYFTLNNLGRITRSNPAAARLVGLTRDQLPGQLFSTYVAAVDRQIFVDFLQQVFAAGSPHACEVLLTAQHSTPRTIHLEATVSSDGKECHAVVIDVTGQKQIEAALRESQTRWQFALEGAGDGVWDWEVATNTMFFSKQWKEIIGYDEAEIGTGLEEWSSRVHPDDLPRVMSDLQPHLEGRTPAYTNEHRMRCKDGSYKWILARGLVITRDAAGKPLRAVGTHTDITVSKQNEAKLTQSTRALDEAQRIASLGSWSLDVASNQIIWTTELYRMYGLDPARPVPPFTEHAKYFKPESWERLIVALAHTRETGIPYEFELETVRQDGSEGWMWVRGERGQDTNGNTVEIRGVAKDITARKQVEMNLRKLARAVEQSPVTVVITDTKGAIEYTNPQFTKITGYTFDEVKGKNFRILKSGVQSPEVYRNLWATISTGGEWHSEMCNQRKDGSLYWEDASISPVVDETGRITHYLAVKEDITARRVAEAQIREQAALLDVAQDAIMVINLDRIVTYWNRAAEKIYGLTSAEALGRTYEELIYSVVPPDFPAAWAQLLKQGTFTDDRQHSTRSGKKIDARTRATVVLDAQDTAKSILLVITDITESKLLEAQFLRAQRMESLGALASGVAHDLNNVLTPILISVELLRPLAKAKHDHEMLQILSDSARRGADIVQQLLLFGRGSDTPRSAMNAAGVVKEVGRMIRETFPKKLVVSIQAPADLRLIEADKTQIHQVLLNLCVNARDAMPQGGRLTLTAENIQIEEPFALRHGGKQAGPYILLRVADTGTGISAANLEKIFDPFFTTKPIGEGTGLGLATVLGIVRSHEGFLVVNSTVGSGTAFEVYLPATVSAVEAAASHSNSLALLGRGEWILLVDDEEPIRSVLQRTLAEDNYHVLVASDGAEALGVFAQNAAMIKLVITDAMMPVMDGAQTVHALRRLNPLLPVIAISGSAQHAEFENDFGPRLRFLSKPFPSELALHLVRQALDEAYPVNPLTRSTSP